MDSSSPAANGPLKRIDAIRIAIGNDNTNARMVIARRSQLFDKTGNISELAKLPCITDIPSKMSIFEFDSIMRYLLENSIPRSEYANVFKTVRISSV